MSEAKREETMAIVVGSFASQLPTSASVAASLPFTKPWRYCAFGGDFFTLGGFEKREANKVENSFCSRSLTIDYGHPTPYYLLLVISY